MSECDSAGGKCDSVRDVMDTRMQAKHMITLKDSVMEDVLKFLDHCEGQL